MNLASTENAGRADTYVVHFSPPLWPRNYFLVPLLSIATALVLFTIAESAARVIWPEDTVESCLVHEPNGGAHFRPNCTSPMKIVEANWTTDRYNECGYRTTAHCGPKAPGTVRIDMLGASFVHGRGVNYDQTFATQVGANVQHQLDHPVEIENLSVFQQRPIDSYRRMSEALALAPDALVYVITPSDVAKPVSREEMAARDLPTMQIPRATKPQLNLLHQVHDWFMQDSRALIVARTFLLRDPATFQRVHLASGTNRAEMPNLAAPDWVTRFSDLQVLIGGMADRAHKAGVPFVLVAIPMRIQATLMQSEQPIPGIDPFVFSKQMETICQQTGITYVDLFQGFDRVPNANRLFYVVDGHLTPEGHDVVAQQLTPVLQDVVRKQLEVKNN